jgi:hypothetical protein
MATPTEVMYGREKLERDGGVWAPLLPAIVSRVVPDGSRPNAKLLLRLAVMSYHSYFPASAGGAIVGVGIPWGARPSSRGQAVARSFGTTAPSTSTTRRPARASKLAAIPAR